MYKIIGITLCLLLSSCEIVNAVRSHEASWSYIEKCCGGIKISKTEKISDDKLLVQFTIGHKEIKLVNSGHQIRSIDYDLEANKILVTLRYGLVMGEGAAYPLEIIVDELKPGRYDIIYKAQSSENLLSSIEL